MVRILVIADVTITCACILALFWFVLARSQRKSSTLVIAILYLIGAPFDMIYGRTSSFWISIVLSFLYLYLYKQERKLTKKEN
jgi:hypothetical protein